MFLLYSKSLFFTLDVLQYFLHMGNRQPLDRFLGIDVLLLLLSFYQNYAKQLSSIALPRLRHHIFSLCSNPLHEFIMLFIPLVVLIAEVARTFLTVITFSIQLISFEHATILHLLTRCFFFQQFFCEAVAQSF